MKQISILIITTYSFLCFYSCNTYSVQEFEIKRSINFNNDWKFINDDIVDASETNFEDSDWRTVHLPHDISVEDLAVQDSLHIGPFYRDVERGGDVGFLKGGTAWYRKHFEVDVLDKNKEFILNFDGIQSEAVIYINGEKAGEHIYGYTAFNLNITEFLHISGSNVIAIKVTNPEINSRWFAGFGIYRDVKLSIVNPVHIADWGVFVTTPVINKEEATVNLAVQVLNTTEKDETVSLVAEIIAPDQSVITSEQKVFSITANSKKKISLNKKVINPLLWNLDTPHLYRAKVKVIKNGKQVDDYEVNFGIRSIDYLAEKGFLLNGKEVLLKGACLHHDNGILGATAFRNSEYRKVEIMKKNGYNSIRTSHNPPSSHFLNACDELGILVIDEAFDQWELPKRKNDYHQYFNSHWEKDIKAMVYRDRNHPSIIMWSFGNEVQERSSSRGIEIAKMLGDKIRSLDVTRPSTQAVCSFWDNKGMNWETHTPATFEVTEIGGYNYMPHKFESDHEKYPDRIMYSSESYPHNAYKVWKKVKELPYVIGDYVWTGMDYIGEAGIGIAEISDKKIRLHHPQPWPWFNAYCGDIDLIGNKKPQSYYRDVVWDKSKVEILVHEPIPDGMWEQVHGWGWPREEPHWNWKVDKGEILSVNVYSAYPLIKLFLNGQLVGEQEIDLEEGITATFQVPYEPGELKAVCYGPNKEEETKVLKTTGDLFGLKLIAEKKKIKANRDEVVYVQVLAVDEKGSLIPTISLPLSLTVEGEGTLLGAGSSYPKIEGSFQDHQFNLFRGQGLIILRSNGEEGNINLTVKTETGLIKNIAIESIKE